MKPKLLLLLKFLGYSFLLFLIGHKFFHWYASALTDSLNVEDIRYHLPPNLQEFLYRSSLTVIAFLALILSTPKMTVMRKVAIVSLGIAVFFVTDFIFIQYLKGERALSEDSFVFELYLCIKWLLPFLLWILPNYQNLRGFIDTGKEAAA